MRGIKTVSLPTFAETPLDESATTTCRCWLTVEVEAVVATDELNVITESAKINCRETVVERAAIGVKTPDDSPMQLFGTDVISTGGDFSMVFDNECCDASSELFWSCNDTPELSSLSIVRSSSLS